MTGKVAGETRPRGEGVGRTHGFLGTSFEQSCAAADLLVNVRLPKRKRSQGVVGVVAERSVSSPPNLPRRSILNPSCWWRGGGVPGGPPRGPPDPMWSPCVLEGRNVGCGVPPPLQPRVPALPGILNALEGVVGPIGPRGDPLGPLHRSPLGGHVAGPLDVLGRSWARSFPLRSPDATSMLRRPSP